MERYIKPTYDELESYVENLQKQLADAQATIAALQADNRTYINERHENMKQIEQLQAMNNRLGVRVETLEAQLTQRTAELEAIRSSGDNAIRRLQAELERVRGERDRWQSKYDVAQMNAKNWQDKYEYLLQHRQGMEG